MSSAKEMATVTWFILLEWADLYKDLAETFSKWEKIDKAYENSYDRFRWSQELAGGNFLVQLMLWAEVLRRHALAADKHGLHEKAQTLRQRAGTPFTDSKCLAKHLLCIDEKAAELEAAKLQLAAMFKNKALETENTENKTCV